MTPEQIKQTVAEIRYRDECTVWINHFGAEVVRKDRAKLLEITDHLQKTIEAQDRVGSDTLLALIKMTEERDKARRIAEKFRDSSERPGGGHTFLPWEKKT